MTVPPPASASASEPRLLTYTQAMYALHAASIAIGVVTTALGYRTYLFGIPSLAAIVLNLHHRAQARGTRLESHFDWQLRTFAWALAGLLVASLAFGSLVVAVILDRVPLLSICFLVLGMWCGVRTARGWVALREGRAIESQGIF